MNKLTERWANTFILVCGIIWGIQALTLIPLRNIGLSSIQIFFWRQLISVLSLALLFFIKDRRIFKIALRDLPHMISIGAGCVLPQGPLYYIAIEQVGAAVSCALYYAALTVTIVLSALILGERISFKKIAVITAVVFGSFLTTGIFTDGLKNVPVQGVLLSFVVGITYGMYGILSKIAMRKYRAETITFYGFLFSFIAVIFFTDLPETVALVNSSGKLITVIAFALFCSVLPYSLFTLGLTATESSKAAIMTSIDLPVATAAGIIFLNEHSSAEKIIGIVMILLANLAMQLGPCQTQKPRKPKINKNF